PGASVLILLATTEERLLPTTRSRCQIVRFGRLPDQFVREHLVKQVELSDEDATYLVGLADGRPGVALQYAAAGLVPYRQRVLEIATPASDDPLAFSKAMQDLAKSLAAGPAAAADDDAEEAGDEQDASEARTLRAARRLALMLLAAFMRDVLRCG